MDKSKLKDIVLQMSEEERAELGQLLLESVLERWSEEDDSDEEADPKNLGAFDLIIEDSDPETS